MSKIVFLFGAGASRGATHITPGEPPLGAELYDRLAEEFPKAWGSESHLGFFREGLRRDFERTMADDVCQRVASIAILEWQRCMALYFARFVPDATGEDLYSRLLRFLNESGMIQGAVFGSLNYDCIFEHAAEAAEFHIEYIPGGQTGSDSIRVLKIHGSCNFVTKNAHRMKPHLSSPGSHVECELECLRPREAMNALEARFRNYDAFCVPVMSLYALGKDSLVAPVQVQDIRNQWGRSAEEAVGMYIVGVRPNEGDRHIWIPVRETKAQIFYIGGRSDHDGWRRANPGIRFLGETFEQGFERLLECLR